jgi:threonine synthase
VNTTLIDRYAEWLPVTDATPRVTLGEGATPCIDSPRIAAALRLRSLHLKLEGLNPTGSFKDRGMTVAVSLAQQDGARLLICASTGNTSASAAAYAARAGLRAAVVIPRDGVAAGKLLQARVHGAIVVAVDAGFDLALRCVRALAERGDVTLVNSVNPHRIAGQKTAAYEIVDELGDAPDICALPVGNAGNITAYWQGFRDYQSAGRCSSLPRMVGGQADGAAPLVHGTRIEHPTTIASAIRIGDPASRDSAIRARDESEGFIDSVSDAQILDAQALLARQEGVFCEPASAASLAVVRRGVERGLIAPGSSVVCVLTGIGLKDPAAPVQDDAPVTAAANPEAIAAALGL